MQFHQLKIIAIEKASSQANTITLEVPEEIRSLFKYNAGQHIAVRLRISGREIIRHYSLHHQCNLDGIVQVTVKILENGQASVFLNTQIKAGGYLEISEPSGNFFSQVKPDDYKSIYCFAAGSGITPIFSIIQNIVQLAPECKIHLLYGSTNEENIIFKQKLVRLQEQFSDRLTIEYILSKSGFWTQWNGLKGRINQKNIIDFLYKHPPCAQTTEYYICGPEEMILSAKSVLQELGVQPDQIHFEFFAKTNEAPETEHNQTQDCQVLATLFNTRHEIALQKGQSILEAMKKNGTPPGFSCESGICGSCKARLIKGTVSMLHNYALSKEQIKKGEILCCQSKPTSNKIEIVID
jgi:ring-1,2-phenylacetyl-CoA epoxidase subunit PaaE